MVSRLVRLVANLRRIPARQSALSIPMDDEYWLFFLRAQSGYLALRPALK
jgi:hypothetical protein